MTARQDTTIIHGLALGRERRSTVRWWSAFLRFARQKPLGAVSGVIVLLLIITGLFGWAIAPSRYDTLDIPNKFLGPSAGHWFGTDSQGRDQFSRIIYGARTSVLIGFGTVAVSTVVAATIGTLSGYYGGKFDLVLQRLIDIWQAFPGLIFVIFLVSILGVSSLTLILTMGLLFSAGSSRLVRGATIATKSSTYVESAKAIGASNPRVMLQHLLPNVFPIIIISASIQVGAAILLESSLSFLGYGTPPPYPSWGRMLQEAQKDMLFYPYLAFFPGAAIGLCVYALNMFGDALRDVLDPRLRGSR